MGRAKVRMDLLRDEKVRYTTFQKRKKGLMKKAYEISTLCDIPVCMIIYGPKRGGRDPMEPEVWCSNPEEFRGMIESYKNRSVDDRNYRTLDLSDFFKDREKKVAEELLKLQRKNSETKYPTWDGRFNYLPEMQLREFVGLLESRIEAVKSKVESMKGGDHHHQNLAASAYGRDLMRSSMQLETIDEEQFDADVPIHYPSDQIHDHHEGFSLDTILNPTIMMNEDYCTNQLLGGGIGLPPNPTMMRSSAMQLEVIDEEQFDADVPVYYPLDQIHDYHQGFSLDTILNPTMMMNDEYYSTNQLLGGGGGGGVTPNPTMMRRSMQLEVIDEEQFSADVPLYYPFDQTHNPHHPGFSLGAGGGVGVTPNPTMMRSSMQLGVIKEQFDADVPFHYPFDHHHHHQGFSFDTILNPTMMMMNDNYYTNQQLPPAAAGGGGGGTNPMNGSSYYDLMGCYSPIMQPIPLNVQYPLMSRASPTSQMHAASHELEEYYDVRRDLQMIKNDY